MIGGEPCLAKLSTVVKLGECGVQPRKVLRIDSSVQLPRLTILDIYRWSWGQGFLELTTINPKIIVEHTTADC
jgi:hypothetical protein